MRKISDQISNASFLIADITGNNANVFFEPGIAHATGKPVIFLTQDAPKDAPVDIRQFEFIQYELGRHEDFLAKLDNAVRNGSSLDISKLYEAVRDLLKQLNLDTGFTHHQASRDEFHALDGFLLPKILQDVTDLNVMQRVRVGSRSVDLQRPDWQRVPSVSIRVYSWPSR